MLDKSPRVSRLLLSLIVGFYIYYYDNSTITKPKINNN